uniref:Putative secreted peptide n=1 Tax=Anopheles braziliensis TaxID=58242 RepID=A0A2M3ZRF0_9DIPT
MLPALYFLFRFIFIFFLVPVHDSHNSTAITAAISVLMRGCPPLLQQLFLLGVGLWRCQASSHHHRHRACAGCISSSRRWSWSYVWSD